MSYSKANRLQVTGSFWLGYSSPGGKSLERWPGPKICIGGLYAFSQCSMAANARPATTLMVRPDLSEKRRPGYPNIFDDWSWLIIMFRVKIIKKRHRCRINSPFSASKLCRPSPPPPPLATCTDIHHTAQRFSKPSPGDLSQLHARLLRTLASVATLQRAMTYTSTCWARGAATMASDLSTLYSSFVLVAIGAALFASLGFVKYEAATLPYWTKQ